MIKIIVMKNAKYRIYRYREKNGNSKEEINKIRKSTKRDLLEWKVKADNKKYYFIKYLWSEIYIISEILKS